MKKIRAAIRTRYLIKEYLTAITFLPIRIETKMPEDITMPNTPESIAPEMNEPSVIKTANSSRMTEIQKRGE